jgi:hypothetical protein
MVANHLFGESLLWWRLLRVAADATTAVLIWALVRDARPRWALPAWAAAAVTVAQPVSANPTAPALALALAAVFAAWRGRPGWAGVAAAATAFFRPDVGVLAALAAAAVLAAGARREGATSRGPGSVLSRGRSAGGRSSGAISRRSATGGTLGAGLHRRRRLPGALVCLLVAALVSMALYAPFVIAAGPGRVWDALVVQAGRDGAWWRLPFPPGYDGGDLKDFATWLAPYAAVVTLVLAAFRFRRVAGLLILGAGAAVYYRTRADLEHAQALLIVAAGLAALVRPKLFGAAVLALLIAVGIANRTSALLRPPDLAPLGDVRVPPADARDIPRVAARVQRLVPPGEPIYVAPRRSDLVTFSNPLLHFFVDRPNVLHRDVLLQAKPEEQANIVDALRARRPKAIIRWTALESARPEPNRRGRPSGSRALDDYLAAAYRLEARYGAYDVLVPR